MLSSAWESYTNSYRNTQKENAKIQRRQTGDNSATRSRNKSGWVSTDNYGLRGLCFAITIHWRSRGRRKSLKEFARLRRRRQRQRVETKRSHCCLESTSAEGMNQWPFILPGVVVFLKKKRNFLLNSTAKCLVYLLPLYSFYNFRFSTFALFFGQTAKITGS